MSDATDDARKAVEADNALAHQRDLARLIDAKKATISREMEPWRERRRTNHFLEEYSELIKRGNRK